MTATYGVYNMVALESPFWYTWCRCK